MTRSDARKRTDPAPAAQPEVGLTGDERDRLRNLIDWHVRCHVEEPTGTFLSLLNINVAAMFDGILAERIEAGRAAGAAEAAETLGEIREVLARAEAMSQRGPDQFRRGPSNVGRAFWEVDWRAAFKALAGFLTEIEQAALRAESGTGEGAGS